MRCSSSVWSPSKLWLLLNSSRRTQLGIIVEEECGSGEIWGETNVDKLFAGDKDQKIAVFDCHLKKRWSADGPLVHVLQPNRFTFYIYNLQHAVQCMPYNALVRPERLHCLEPFWGFSIFIGFYQSTSSIFCFSCFALQKRATERAREKWRGDIWGCENREQRRNIGRKRKMKINTDKCSMGRHHKSYHKNNFCSGKS